MPPRKVSGGRQATLSFNHRVTKASVAKASAKAAALLSKAVDSEKKKADTEIAPETEKTEKTEIQVDAKEEDDETPQAIEDAVQPAPKSPVVRSPLEAEADAIPDAQIRRYWRSIEADSIAQPVHQESLGLGEKVLRHFDVSSQFGPCVGIERKKRWMRAQRLGLAPPLEVLAVMLHEEAAGAENVQRSSFDAILNASVVA